MDTTDTNTIKGEGDHEAGRRYQEATTDFVASGRVARGAAEAARALDGPQAKELESARAEAAGGQTGSTIFELLRESHDKQRTLLTLVGKTHGDSRGRRELFDRLVAELRDHAAREERVLYAEMLGIEMCRDEAGHSVHEHEEIESLIARLEQMSYSSSAWIGVFDQLAEKVKHHLDEEEHGVFQLAGRAIDDTRKAELALEYGLDQDAEVQA